MADPLTVIEGDALSVLRTLESESVQCCVTSPPYWGLRDYGHEGQIGLEKTPEEYVARLVEVFAEVRRVLRADGTLWLNLGDTYAGGGNGGGGSFAKDGIRCALPGTDKNKAHRYGSRGVTVKSKRIPRGSGRWGGGNNHVANLKPKDLIGVPWMVAFALRADRWYLRSDIIWSKPNPMPESVTDRPTKSHEYIFLLSKSQKYFYNAEAIKEPGSLETPARMGRAHKGYNPPGQTAHSGVAAPRPNRSRGSLRPHEGFNGKWDAMSRVEQCTTARNKRSVWTVATSPFPGAHFATFPPELITPCILAGSRPAGKRCDCDEVIGTDRSGARPLPPALLSEWLSRGWLTTPEPCDCPIGDADTVLDPFAGSGTTGKVAIELGRRTILIEPKAEYVEMIKRRCRTTIGLPLAI